MMKQHTRRTRLLRTTHIASALCFCTFLLVACTAKKDAESSESAAQEMQNARESGVAQDAAKDAMIGEWRMMPKPHEKLDLQDADIDVLNGLDARTKAGFAFEKDNTVRFGARLADENLEEKHGTWKIQDVELDTFGLQIQWEDEDTAHELTVKPRANGDLDATLQSQEFVLRKASIDDYLASPEDDEDDAQEEDDGTPTTP